MRTINCLLGLSCKKIYNQRHGTKLNKRNHPRQFFPPRLLCSDNRKFTEACFTLSPEWIQSCSDESPDVGKSKATDPSQNITWNVTLIQSCSSNTHCHRLARFLQWLK